jgi:hypothetical protein
MCNCGGKKLEDKQQEIKERLEARALKVAANPSPIVDGPKEYTEEEKVALRRHFDIIKLPYPKEIQSLQSQDSQEGQVNS